MAFCGALLLLPYGGVCGVDAESESGEWWDGDVNGFTETDPMKGCKDVKGSF